MFRARDIGIGNIGETIMERGVLIRRREHFTKEDTL